MKLYLITYDKNAGDNYEPLYKRIQECGSAWHGMQNTWFVESSWSAVQIRDHCAKALDSNDKLLVSLVTESAWLGFSTKGSEWIVQKVA